MGFCGCGLDGDDDDGILMLGVVILVSVMPSLGHIAGKRVFVASCANMLTAVRGMMSRMDKSILSCVFEEMSCMFMI